MTSNKPKHNRAVCSESRGLLFHFLCGVLECLEATIINGYTAGQLCYSHKETENKKSGCLFDEGALKLDSKNLLNKCSSFVMQVLDWVSVLGNNYDHCLYFFPDSIFFWLI